MHEPRLVTLSGSRPSYGMAREMIAGALACMVASAVTNPLDVIKVRMQAPLKLPLSVAAPALPLGSLDGFRATARCIVHESGWQGLLLPGLSAAMIREIFYSSIRFGLYSRIKEGIVHVRGQLAQSPSAASSNFLDRLLAGMLTGAVGSAIANPTDLVKIRLQHETGKLCPQTGLFLTGPCAGARPAYRSTLDAFRLITTAEGIGMDGWFRGVQATMARAALLTGGQLASYESAKISLKSRAVLSEGPMLHIICSIWSGLVAATFCAPADIVKTRLMVDRRLSLQAPQYTGAWDCFFKIVKHEGLIGLFKGWMPSYLRLAPHFIISLPLNEQFRRLLNMSAL